MDTDTLVENLSSLAQLDIDAVLAYGQAIKNIDVPSVREQLISFQADHERYIRDLSACIQGYGAEPPDYSRDFKGFLIEGFAAIRSASGTAGALKAMKSNEEKTNRDYNEALSWDLPADVRALVQRNYEDERRHLRYVEEALQTRVWEAVAT